VVPALLFAAYERLDSSGGSVTPPPASPRERAAAHQQAFADEAGRAGPSGRRVVVLGLNLPVDTWRRAAVGLAVGISVLIAATYVLNATVGSSIIRADAARGNADYSS
jgi:hypothetical protein